MEKRINHKHLKGFLLKVLKKAGLDKHSADSVATGLYETSLRGVDSHGVRLINHYVYSAINGRKNPKPKYKFVKTFPALGVLNADNAFGHAAGIKAIDICMKIAGKLGVGIVAVKNSNCNSLQHVQFSTGSPKPNRLLSEFHKSNVKSVLEIFSWLPVRNFITSIDWQEAAIPIAGARTPAVSHVSCSPLGGGCGNKQRRQGVEPGIIVMTFPWLAITPANMKGVFVFTAKSLRR